MVPGLGRSPGGGHGNPLQYSCPENPHGQRSLVGYSAWGCKELKMTERLSRAQKDTTSGCRHDPRWIWLEEKMSMGDHLVFSSEVVDVFLCWDLQGDDNP